MSGPPRPGLCTFVRWRAGNKASSAFQRADSQPSRSAPPRGFAQNWWQSEGGPSATAATYSQSHARWTGPLRAPSARFPNKHIGGKKTAWALWPGMRRWQPVSLSGRALLLVQPRLLHVSSGESPGQGCMNVVFLPKILSSEETEATKQQSQDWNLM